MLCDQELFGDDEVGSERDNESMYNMIKFIRLRKTKIDLQERGVSFMRTE